MSAIRFDGNISEELLRSWDNVSKSPPPLVIINGKAKSNPTLQQVVDEYSEGRKSMAQ
jgi:hypothetical protein